MSCDSIRSQDLSFSGEILPLTLNMQRNCLSILNYITNSSHHKKLPMGPIVFFFLCMQAKAEANIFFQLQRLHQCIVRFAFATQWTFYYDLTSFSKMFCTFKENNSCQHYEFCFNNFLLYHGCFVN